MEAAHISPEPPIRWVVSADRTVEIKEEVTELGCDQANERILQEETPPSSITERGGESFIGFTASEADKTYNWASLYRNLDGDDSDIDLNEEEDEDEDEEKSSREGGGESTDEDVPLTRFRVPNWTRLTELPEQKMPLNIKNYTEVSGPRFIPRSATRPAEFFELLFSSELQEYICSESNKYALEMNEKYRERNAKSKTYERLFSWWTQSGGMTRNRLRAVLGLWLNMGLVWKPDMKEYWNTKDALRATPGFARIMSRDKFLFCLANLHLNDNRKQEKKGKPGYDSLFKVRPVLDQVESLLTKYYVLNEFVSIDENLLGFKNRTSLKQYLPNKFGLKLWVLADSANGYVYKFKLHTGASNDTERETYDVVMSLMDGLLDKGHTLITDNFYTSVPLASALTYQHNTQLVGTLRGNRKYLPSVPKCRVGEQVVYRSGRLLYTAVRQKTSHKKPLLLLSTRNIATEVKVRRAGKDVTVPECVEMYSRKTGGVDLAEQKIYSYENERRSYKWYFKIFFSVINRLVLNSYILYQDTVQQRQQVESDVHLPPLSRRTFLASVIDDFCKNVCDNEKVAPIPPSLHSGCKLEKMKITKTSSGKKRQPEKDCTVCSNRKVKRTRTTYTCAACNIGVCRECFHKHSKK
ncbi:piggyBac transposable element-derived protein 4-like [Acipenser ruthenus]|uniref:piggyBac transposable element-derived protein 4-like n=1 Tax=Acipenser ruthenus TaxID=7906 RepID=UPI0027411490|nr:piggyBac transposable element-derived protein 4-like [Acipenser ruthenus]